MYDGNVYNAFLRGQQMIIYSDTHPYVSKYHRDSFLISFSHLPRGKVLDSHELAQNYGESEHLQWYPGISMPCNRVKTRCKS